MLHSVTTGKARLRAKRAAGHSLVHTKQYRTASQRELHSVTRSLRGRVTWHPKLVVVRLADGREYHLGAKPIEQAEAVAKRLNLEFDARYTR